jgi:hypothetical protein
MKKKIGIASACCFCLLVSSTQIYAQVDAQIDVPTVAKEHLEMTQERIQKIMRKKMQRSGGTIWTPTEWQKTLSAITVRQGGQTRDYAFADLIKADGHLCPGSARAYKALQVALPLLYDHTVPVKGDFKITYGASPCTARVFNFFMQGFTAKAYLESDPSTRGNSITISRISTGKKVETTYALSGVRGHHSAGAQAGDVILHAEDGDGMAIRREE